MIAKQTISTLLLACAFSLIGATAGRAAIVNGGFETGDLSGWSGSSGYTSAVTSASGLSDPDWSPVEGNYFGLVTSGIDEGVYSLLSQEFSATPGQELSLYVFFDTDDYLPYNDDGYVNLVNTDDNSTINLYAESVSSVGDYGADGWTLVSHTFAGAGMWRIEAGVRNVDDNSVASQLGIDVVGLTEPVPEPASILSFAGLGLCLFAARWRRRKPIGEASSR